MGRKDWGIKTTLSLDPMSGIHLQGMLAWLPRRCMFYRSNGNSCPEKFVADQDFLQNFYA